MVVGATLAVLQDELAWHWYVKALTTLAHTGVGVDFPVVQLEVTG